MNIAGAIAFPHSLGMYYTAVSQYLGFRKFGDEFKVMGLAAYGEPAYLDEFRRIVRTNGGFGFRLGLEYFKHHRTGPEMSWSDAGKTPELGAMFSDHMAERLGPSREPSAPVEKIHRDEVSAAAEVSCARVERAGFCFGERDELFDRTDAECRISTHEIRIPVQQRDRREIAYWIDRHFLEQRGRECKARHDQQERVAVGICVSDELKRSNAGDARTGAIVDDEALSENVAPLGPGNEPVICVTRLRRPFAVV